MGKSNQITKAQTIRKRVMSKIVFGVRRRFRFLLVVFNLELKLWTKSGAISSVPKITGDRPHLKKKGPDHLFIFEIVPLEYGYLDRDSTARQEMRNKTSVELIKSE